MTPRPDFFIVGAPKCGTTAMYDYLRQHPQVFVPFIKEPLFFGDDLTRRYGRMSLEEYLALFRDAREGQRIGEASAWYLYSASAAEEIKAFSPEARIIVMLRDPVDMMYAQHSQLLFSAQEDIVDFGEALDAEPDRRRGERLPSGPVRPENLFYRDSARFSGQLQRYLDVFGPERVHVIVNDDLAADTPGVFRGVLEFLEVDPSVEVQFGRSNPNKRVRNPVLQRLVFAPPGGLVRLAPILRRFPGVHALRALVLRANSAPAPRQPMDPGLRRRLTAEFAPEVERLSTMLGRDLSAWSEAAR